MNPCRPDHTSSLLIFFLALAGFAAASAKDFINLTFDDGSYPSVITPDFLQPVELVLPGWTARMGDHVLSEVLWNSVYSENGSVGVFSSGASVQGRYGVGLRGGPEFPDLGPHVPASISQVGRIPDDAHSLLFRAFGHSGSLTEVRLDGTSLPLVSIGGQGSERNFGVDVSSFAGREVELRLLNSSGPDGVVAGTFFDSLTFSFISVPEPSTCALLGIGGVALLWTARRDQNAGQ